MSNRPGRGRQKQRKDPTTATTLAAPLKIVVRHLPPNLPENVFHTSIASWHKVMDWSDYVPGILADGRDKSDVYSRAYVKFRKHIDLQDFIKRYQGHVFISADGKEYRAQVEIALYQRIPKPPGKAKDPLNGTLEEDAEYKAFLESLKAPPAPPKEENPLVPKVTPLIEFLRAQKAKSDAKAKARKAKDAATKAKQAEEKKKLAQASADAVTAKIQEKKATEKSKGKAGPKSKNIVESVQDAEAKKNIKKSKVPKPKKVTDESSSAATKEATAGKAKQTQAVPPTAEKKRPPKAQTSTNGKTANKDDAKAVKANPKKNKRKDGKPTANSSATANKRESPLDISGPTPAEMAALARGNT